MNSLKKILLGAAGAIATTAVAYYTKKLLEEKPLKEHIKDVKIKAADLKGSANQKLDELAKKLDELIKKE